MYKKLLKNDSKEILIENNKFELIIVFRRKIYRFF